MIESTNHERANTGALNVKVGVRVMVRVRVRVRVSHESHCGA